MYIRVIGVVVLHVYSMVHLSMHDANIPFCMDFHCTYIYIYIYIYIYVPTLMVGDL